MTRAHTVADTLTLTRLAELSPAWALLRAKTAPAIVSVLATLFRGDNRQVAGSELIMAVEPMLIDIREQVGVDLPKSATAYVNDWVKAGYLIRRSPQGTREEFYELSTDAHLAIDYIQQLVNPQRSVTRSRLGTLYTNLRDLAAETDPDEATAIRRLEQQRDLLQQKIDSIRSHGVGVISDDEAVEKAREILALVADLPADFSRVRSDIEEIDRELRESIVEEKLNAGEVLDNVFRGVDLITESDAGKAFNGFYEVFLDQEQSVQFDATLEAVMAREFVRKLEIDERIQLAELMETLDHSSGQVHDSMTGLSRSLRRFVQSREAEAQQALTRAINNAQQLALQIAKEGKVPSGNTEVELELTTRQPRSVASWVLQDPMDYRVQAEMLVNEDVEIDLDAMRARIRESEIDWVELMDAINAAVESKGRASISDVLTSHPATQGLASVIGLIKLAHKHGERCDGTQQLRWKSQGGRKLQARYPIYEFTGKVS